MRFALIGIIGLACTLAVLLVPSHSQSPKDPYAAHVSQSGPRSPEDERKGFHVPPGFEVELVAAEPFVRKPININFDERGRLWVSESVEYPFPAMVFAPRRDTIRILGSFGDDGLANEVTTFTSGLNIPIGVLPVTGGAIVYSIPNIYRYRDLDGDDRADQKEILYGTIGFKDTHGMTGEFTRGFDGWIYACHGYSNTSEVKGKDGASIVMQSGNTYRFKEDGSHVEYFTHGQVNPFGLSFDPLGNLYSCDCHTRPIYQLLRGAYYPSFGKAHDGLGFGPEVMTHDHGSTAIAGITYYAADHFPPAYRDTIFIGNVVTNRINHDRLERHGSTMKALMQPDFLSSDDPWFRPVDIKLGPDGALYVADFYNRIIGHYEVPLVHPGRDRERGRIWRIVYRGPDGKGKPRLPRADWGKATVSELVGDLAHPNLVVRMTATTQLVERGGQPAVAAVRPLFSGKSTPFQRMHGLWVLERLGALDDTALESAAQDADRGVRVHALRVLAERPALSEPLHRLVVHSLRDADAYVQRAAADALGRHPAPANVRALLDLRQGVLADDTHLLHVVRMALRDHFQADSAWSQLPVVSWNERDARALADVATGIPSAAAAHYLLHYLPKYPETRANQLRYVYHIARFGAPESAHDLLAFVRGDRSADPQHQLALFREIYKGNQAGGVELSDSLRDWGEELTRKLLASTRKADVVAGIELGGSLRVTSAFEYCQGTVEDRAAPEDQRGSAMGALMAWDPATYTPVIGQILADSSATMGLREKAANLLAGANLPKAQAELLKSLPTAPERLARPIALGLTTTKPGAAQLLDTVAAGKASAQLLQDRGIADRLAKANPPKWKERVTQLTRNLPAPDQRFHDLLERRKSSFGTARKDPIQGAKVFEKHCAICHTIANRGAKIGPQLDGIGIRGFDRLFEDIVEPSRNVDQAFRMTSLYLNNGKVVSGLLLREEGQVFVLADNQGKEVRVSRDTVEERTLSQLSPMPANLIEQIPEADFFHLLAYLLAQQPTKETANKDQPGKAGP